MSEVRDRRRLAAILLGDVAGYSRLMERDEAETLRALKAHRAEVIDPALALYNGRLVSTPGDGILVEFGSAVDAVACAVAIQRAMAVRNASAPQERRIIFRLGINLGDIIFDGDDIYGEGVNVAARLEALCQPGGICISRSVLEQIENKLHLPFADRGEQALKNIARPVQVFDLSADAINGLPEADLSFGTKGALAAPKRRERRRILLALGAAAALAVPVIAGAYLWLDRTRSADEHQASPSTEPDPLAGVSEYIDGYDGGDCFLAVPVRLAKRSAGIEAFASSREATDAFAQRFAAALGFEPQVDAQVVSQAQCPAVDFLRKLRAEGGPAPLLDLRRISLQSGQSQAGEIRAFGHRALALLYVQEDGLVQDVSDKLVADGDAEIFEFPVTHGVAAVSPQLLLAVASLQPLISAKVAQPTDAARFFAGVAREAAEKGEKLAAAAKLFLLRP